MNDKLVTNEDVVIDIMCPECKQHGKTSIQVIYDDGQRICIDCDEVMDIVAIHVKEEETECQT